MEIFKGNKDSKLNEINFVMGSKMNFFRAVFNLIKDVQTKIILFGYDNYSIAEYFRKQGAQIGEDCYLSVSQLGNQPYLVRIGNRVGVGNNVSFITHNVGWCFRDEIPDLQVFGPITIKDNCFISPHSIILLGVTIGPNSIVGVGSVVTKDVPPNSIVAGNPAKVIGPIDKYKEKVMKMWSEQKPPGYLPELIEGKFYKREYLHKLFGLQENQAKLKPHLINLFFTNTGDIRGEEP